MSDFRLEIVVTFGGKRQACHVLEPGQYLIGRDPSCHVLVNLDDVSRKHARLLIERDKVYFEDLGSTSGTTVDGQTIDQQVELKVPAKIIIGGAVLVITPLEAPEPVRLEAPPANPLVEEFRKSSDYRIVAHIAAGGQGSVYLAEDTKLRRSVAIKKLLSHKRQTPEAVARFVQEARIIGQLEHPSIVPIYDAGVDADGDLFYAMKLVKGMTLAEALQQIKDGNKAMVDRYPLDKLLAVFDKVCDALAYAHSKGVLHRDLKPQNVMLGEFGEVWVMDWGIARLRDYPEDGHAEKSTSDVSQPITTQVTKEGRRLGTLTFMAPEQVEGKTNEIDDRTDVYGLAAVLYNILTLEPPFRGNDEKVVSDMVRTGELRPPTVFNQTLHKQGEPKSPSTGLPHCPNGQIDERLSNVVVKAMRRRQSDRHQTVQELQMDVVRFRADLPTSADVLRLVTLFSLWMKRNAKGFSVAVFVAILIAGFVFNVIVSNHKINAALEGLRNTGPFLLEKSQDLVSKHNYPEALRAIEHAITITPENPAYHVQRGNLLQSLFRFSEARDAYEAALKHDPNNSLAAENLQLCLEILKSGSKDEQSSLVNLTKLRSAMFKQERIEEAQDMSQKQLEKDKVLRTTHLANERKLLGNLGIRGEVKIDERGFLLLDLSYSPIENLTPLKGIPLNGLNLQYTKVKDLTPLKGMPLKSLNLHVSQVTDFSPLRGMQLEDLELGQGRPYEDLNPLKGMPLKSLGIAGVSDIRALKGMPLRNLGIVFSRVSDLSVLGGMPLERIYFDGGQVTDLSPLRGMSSLRSASFNDTPIRDISPLTGMRLESLSISHTRVTDLAPLQSMSSLRGLSLNGLQVHDLSFLQGLVLTHIDLAETSVTNLSALTRMPLEGLNLSRTPFTDLQSLTGLRSLRVLNLSYTKVSDLQPLESFALGDLNLQGAAVTNLKGLNSKALTHIRLDKTKISDINELKGAPLDGWVYLSETEVSDISALRGARIKHLFLHRTKVRDISPLRGMPLKSLTLYDCNNLEDLSPLAECKDLEDLRIPIQAKNIEFLRQLPKLKQLGYSEEMTYVEDFWKNYDARKGAKQ